jgi:serine/threonine-protein kinase
MMENKTRVIESPGSGTRLGKGRSAYAAEASSAPHETPPSLIPADTPIVNTYRVKRLLGSGGMGEVYLARHLQLGTWHAVKVIHPALFSNQQVLDLFRREAAVLRGVRHDAIVSYDGFFRDEAGRSYLVMEYVDGPSLSECLGRGPLSLDEVFQLRGRLAAGLAAAHRRGAVHRDLSPDNVILPEGDVEQAKLIDFGLCKLTDPAQQTIVGSDFAGMLRYASPEQLGLFAGAVDLRSDIYSFGLLLAAAATGRPLGMGDTFDAVLRARRSVPELSALPPPLREQIAAMLHPDPALRPADVTELVRRWPAPRRGGAEPVNDVGPVHLPRARRSPARHRLWLSVGVVALAAAMAGVY